MIHTDFQDEMTEKDDTRSHERKLRTVDDYLLVFEGGICLIFAFGKWSENHLEYRRPLHIGRSIIITEKWQKRKKWYPRKMIPWRGHQKKVWWPLVGTQKRMVN